MGLVTMSGNQMHGHLPAPFTGELTTKNFRGVNACFPLDAKSVMALERRSRFLTWFKNGGCRWDF